MTHFVKSILIVDDSEADRYLLRRDLQAIKYTGEIFEAEHGEEALEFFEHFEANVLKYGDSYPTPIIFLDINMPVKNGFEFLKEFEEMKESNAQLTSIIVMMYTSSGQAIDIEKASQFKSVKKYLMKGRFTQADLEKIISINS